MTHCEETLGHSADPILTDLCCYYCQDLHWGMLHATSRPHFNATLTPLYRIIPFTGDAPRYRWSALAPSIFWALILSK